MSVIIQKHCMLHFSSSDKTVSSRFRFFAPLSVYHYNHSESVIGKTIRNNFGSFLLKHTNLSQYHRSLKFYHLTILCKLQMDHWRRFDGFINTLRVAVSTQTASYKNHHKQRRSALTFFFFYPKHKRRFGSCSHSEPVSQTLWLSHSLTMRFTIKASQYI